MTADPAGLTAPAPAVLARAAAPADALQQKALPASRPASEIELKLIVPEGARDAMRRRMYQYGSEPPVKMASVYFDTRDRRLARQRAALRIRRIGEGPGAQWIQTLKTNDNPGALSHRDEWETPVAGPRPRPVDHAGSPLQRLLGDGGPISLVSVFRTEFERTERTVLYRGARIELALDEGQVTAGKRAEPICELELELRQGPVSAVFDLALELIGRGPRALALRPEPASKAARGYRLAGRVKEQPVPADAEGFSALLRPDLNHLDAARRIVGHGVQRVLANASGAARGEDLEYVHQARVALRRTRSTLRVLGVACAADDPIARDLRWMADCFGAVRDWDVLLTQTLPELRETEADKPDWQPGQWSMLVERAQRLRQRQQLQLRAMLGSARFARASLQLLRWAEEETAAAVADLTERARRAIERGHERLSKAARHLGKLPPRGRHRLRILAKRQRYALDLLAPLLSGGAPARTLKPLSRLQQLLGEINDAHVAVQRLSSLTRSRELIRRAERWSNAVVRHNLPKAKARVARLNRRGSGM